MADVNLDAIKAALKAEDWRGALDLLSKTVAPDHSYTVQSRAAKLFSRIPVDQLGLRPIKLAIVANITAEHLVDVLKYWLAIEGFNAEIYLAPFGMMMQSVLDPQSELYAFQPDIVWLFGTHRDIRLEVPAGSDKSVVRDAVDRAVSEQAMMWDKLSALKCIVLHNNADIPTDDPFGNFAGVAPWGARSAYRLYNFELGSAAGPGVTIFDLDDIATAYGKKRWFDSRFWFHSKHGFALDAIGLVASAGARLIAAAKGRARKALVLDLDNTLWGGIIGDDGMEGIRLGTKADGEAFSAFQAYLHALKERGIILTVCSKNVEANAKEAFEKHPDMKLRLPDIAVFTANWESKVENIRNIAATLNLGLDSLVFVDDNPVEREAVRRYLPMVAVPEMPEDPSGYIEALAAGGYFEALAFSGEDRERSRYYRENAMRSELQNKFKDGAEYLASLEMVAEAGPLDSFQLPRMAQLINKSNQFHLTGTRYSESDLVSMVDQPDYFVRYFKLRDRFGDNGLISVIVLKQVGMEMRVDTWVMSCRVLGRSMEEFICNEMTRIARAQNCDALVGYYRPSKKNGLVAKLYEKLGFEAKGEEGNVCVWRLDLESAPDELQASINLPAVAAQ